MIKLIYISLIGLLVITYSQNLFSQGRYDKYYPIQFNYPQPTQEDLERRALVKYLEEQERKEAFSNAITSAFESYNLGNYSNCLYYTDVALRNGYNHDLYYIRGMAYYQLGDKYNAKRTLKKAQRKGSYRATEALNNYFR